MLNFPFSFFEKDKIMILSTICGLVIFGLFVLERLFTRRRK